MTSSRVVPRSAWARVSLGFAFVLIAACSKPVKQPVEDLTGQDNLASGALVWPSLKKESALIETVSVMAETAPQNATETMLSIHMIATHEAGLLFLKRAALQPNHGRK